MYIEQHAERFLIKRQSVHFYLTNSSYVLIFWWSLRCKTWLTSVFYHVTCLYNHVTAYLIDDVRREELSFRQIGHNFVDELLCALL